MSIELIIKATEDLDWKQCEQSGMWRTTDGEHAYWIDYLDGGYYVEVVDDPDNADMWFSHHNAVIQYIRRFSDPFLVLNSSKCTVCGKILQSLHRHDFVGCKCPEATRLFIDGGNAYKRTVGAISQSFSMNVYSNERHGLIREALHRGSYGKDGKQPHTWVVMENMSDEYLDNLIKYMEEVDNSNNPYYSMYLAEKQYRKDYGISVKD
jgi:hypothetical protein